MNHRFGEASYALMNDFYLADGDLKRFCNSPEYETLPEEEREAAYSMLICRLIDARAAVAAHPPWVLTLDGEVDGATIRIVASICRALRDTPGIVLPEDGLRKLRDSVTAFIAAEFRRVLFDRELAQQHGFSSREEVIRDDGRTARTH